MIQLLDHERFGALRLRDLVDLAELGLHDDWRGQVSEASGWEYAERVWICERFGFTEFLRPQNDPENLHTVSIDLVSSPATAQRILGRLSLPLAQGMGLADLETALGTKGVAEPKMVPDRQFHEFELGSGQSAYSVSCLIQDEDGLIYLTVAIP